ncbi:unnamed protein product [Clonostachys byssicola]|uniref:Zn(2)-C6 fungal-type domain-containing protein n=1 Tax=Clonostachys byssicola TaxID=160290 RepID=A0A9N9UN11_9HYPO|nr:unnamed protein product [Clonostachys byssicola]
MSPPSGGHQPLALTRHKKTFTGCWTCRARRIRCDEGKPGCRQCRRKGVLCEGYDVRLQWVRNNRSGDDFPSLFAPRSGIAPDSNRVIFKAGAVDQILAILDSHEAGTAKDSAANGKHEDFSRFLDCFGVFRSARTPTPIPPPPAVTGDGGSSGNVTDDNNYRGEAGGGGKLPPNSNLGRSRCNTNGRQSSAQSCIDVAGGYSLSPESATSSGLHSNGGPLQEGNESSSPCYSRLDTLQNPISTLETTPQEEEVSFAELLQTARIIPALDIGPDKNHHPLEPSSEDVDALTATGQLILHGGAQDDEHFLFGDIDCNEMGIGPSFVAPSLGEGSPLCRSVSSHLKSDENFLLDHYSKRVLYLFCVIDHGKSPWKSIHLPRALQARGECTVHGSTSMIREALVNTLLAISAFFLSNDCQSMFQLDDALGWWSAADAYRCRAINLLRNAVECDLHSRAPPKYKEFLATALSMVTMNAISGDTETCKTHLDGAYHLMQQAKQWKHRYSPKAASLHRIYFFLRVIYESTAPSSDRKSRQSGYQSRARGGGGEKPIDIFCREFLRPQRLQGSEPMRNDLDGQKACFERVYGIPDNLLLLLADVIDLLDKINELNDGTTDGAASSRVSDLLEMECEILEKAVMDWPVNVGLDQQVADTASLQAKFVHHHTIAFYNALIIYFGRNVRQVGHRYLSPYVEAVLNSMEAIEALKVGMPVVAAPTLWPAFIAATEAFEPGLQERFRHWYQHAEIYRFESLRMGLKVLEEVWEEGSLFRQQKACRWREIVERRGICLILS